MLHVITILCCALLLLAGRLINASLISKEDLLTRAKNMALLSEPELQYWEEHNLELDGVPALVWHVKVLLMQRRLPQALDMLEKHKERFAETEEMKKYYKAFQLTLQSATGYGVSEKDWKSFDITSEDHPKAHELIAPEKILAALGTEQHGDPAKCEEREALQLREIYNKDEDRQKKALVLWRLALLTAVTDPDQAFDYIVESFELFNQDGQYKAISDQEPYLPSNILFRFVTLEVGEEKARLVAEYLNKIRSLIEERDAPKVIERARPEVIKQVTILAQETPEPTIVEQREGGVHEGEVVSEIRPFTRASPSLVNNYALYRSLRSVDIRSASDALIAAYAGGAPHEANKALDLQFVLEHATSLDAGLPVENSENWQSPKIFFALENLWGAMGPQDLHKVFSKLPVKLLVRISGPILTQTHESVGPVLEAARTSVEERLVRLSNSRNHSEYVYSLIALLRLGGISHDLSRLRSLLEEAVTNAHLTETEIFDLKEAIVSVSLPTGNPLPLLHLQAALANGAPASQLREAFDSWKDILRMGRQITEEQQSAYNDIVSSLHSIKLARVLSLLNDSSEYGELQRFYSEAVGNISSPVTRERALELFFTSMAYRLLNLDPIGSLTELETHKKDVYIAPAYQDAIFERCHDLFVTSLEVSRFVKRPVNCLIALSMTHPANASADHWRMAMEMSIKVTSNIFIHMLLTKAGGESRLLDAMFPAINPPLRLIYVAREMYEASTQSTWRDRDILVTRFAEYLWSQPQERELVLPPIEGAPTESPLVEIVCTEAFQASLYLGPTISAGSIEGASLRQLAFNNYMERAERHLPKCRAEMIPVFTNQVIAYLQRYPPEKTEDWPASENFAGPLLHAMIKEGAKKLAIRLYIRNRAIIDVEHLGILMSILTELEDFKEIVPYLKKVPPEKMSMALTKVVEWPTLLDAIHASTTHGSHDDEATNVKMDESSIVSRIDPHRDIGDLILYYAVLGRLLDSEGNIDCTVDGGAQKIRQAIVCIDAARLISPSHLLPIYDFAEAFAAACPGAGGSHNSPIIPPLTLTECLGSKLPVKGLFWTALADKNKYPESMDYTVRSLQVYRDQREEQSAYLGKVRHFNNPANITMMLQLARGTGMDAALRQELAEIPILVPILTSRAVRRGEAPKQPVFTRLHKEKLVLLPSPDQVKDMVARAEHEQELLTFETQLTLEEGSEVREIEALIEEEPVKEIILEWPEPFVRFMIGPPEENVEDTGGKGKDAGLSSDNDSSMKKQSPVLQYARCKDVLKEQLKDVPEEDRRLISSACLVNLPEESFVAFLEHEENLPQLTFQLTRSVVARLGPSFITQLSDRQLRSLWEAHPLLNPRDHPYMALQESLEIRRALVAEGKNDTLRVEAYLVNPRIWDQEYTIQPILNSKERPQLLANLDLDDFKAHLHLFPEMRLDPISIRFLGAGVPPWRSPCQAITKDMLAKVPNLKRNANGECQLYIEETVWREEDDLFLRSISDLTDASEIEKREHEHNRHRYERQRERKRRLTVALFGNPSYYASDEELAWQQGQLIEALEDRMLQMSHQELQQLEALVLKGELTLPSLMKALEEGRDLEELSTFNVMRLKGENFVIQPETEDAILAPFRKLMMTVWKHRIQRLKDKIQQRLKEQRRNQLAGSRWAPLPRNSLSVYGREPQKEDRLLSDHISKIVPGIQHKPHVLARVSAFAGMRGRTDVEEGEERAQFPPILVATLAISGIVLALVVVALPATLVFRRRNA